MSAALIFGAWGYGVMRIERIEPRLAPGELIGVVQGNVKQKLGRPEAELTAQLNGHIALHKELLAKCAGSKDGMPALVCWAETMVPGALDTDYWGRQFTQYVASTGIPALVGSNYIPLEDSTKPDDQQRCFNAGYVIDGNGRELFHVCKRRLVAFGEYIPLTYYMPFLKALRSVTRDQYTPGDEPSPVREIAGYRMALNICVEDIHPDIARELSLAGADTLVNITNDGWFYNTYGPQAHLRSAAFRAIEVRRPLLRVTNTGVTASIDPLGRIEVLVPPETVGVGTTRLLRIQSGESGEEQSGEKKASPFALPRTIYMVVGEMGVGLIFLSILFGCFWIGSQNPLDTSEL